MLWRHNLLASYRTQWSCVGRLRSEIDRLRQQLAKRDVTIDQLRRENFNLRNTLVHRSKFRMELIELLKSSFC
ncbi:hypothetical protein BLA29_005769 [Euroglyphus maynei]|uniref:Uncharacterized protein n=1 Tax=Euroglyphus maynei TaxID=6958 RepID=A0A1Y3BA49_EURMA|nr:hypothetical protein BLA29_005769 [Euroglyphus maynei]